MANILYYLNGDFDLRLAGNATARLTRLVDEMNLWFLPVASTGDAVFCSTMPCCGFTDYLASAGLGGGAILRADDRFAGTGVAWGWDPHATETLRACGATVESPPTTVVATANAREFSAAINADSLSSSLATRVCRTENELSTTLGEQHSWPCVVKPNHGNAGIGFHLVASAGGCEAAVVHGKKLLARDHGPVFVEPWLQRTLDISTCFSVSGSGQPEGIRIARAKVTGTGASYGTLYGPEDSRLQPHSAGLHAAAGVAAARLHALGYTGPANIDSMVVRTGNGEELVPMVELNARYSMGHIAHLAAQRLGWQGWYLMRTLGKQHHTLPDSYAKLSALLENNTAGRGGHGVLVLTPLRVESEAGQVQPHRSIFFVTADSEKELMERDTALTTALKR